MLWLLSIIGAGILLFFVAVHPHIRHEKELRRRVINAQFDRAQSASAIGAVAHAIIALQQDNRHEDEELELLYEKTIQKLVWQVGRGTSGQSALDMLKELPCHPLDLSNRSLGGLDCAGLPLEGAKLCHANLIGAKLSGFNLVGCDLRGAILKEANLEGADLSGANLEGTSFKRACLRDACLAGATVTGATFKGADLTGADLSGVDMDAARFT